MYRFRIAVYIILSAVVSYYFYMQGRQKDSLMLLFVFIALELFLTFVVDPGDEENKVLTFLPVYDRLYS